LNFPVVGSVETSMDGRTSFPDGGRYVVLNLDARVLAVFRGPLNSLVWIVVSARFAVGGFGAGRGCAATRRLGQIAVIGFRLVDCHRRSRWRGFRRC
jgi:hypothetical protein